MRGRAALVALAAALAVVAPKGASSAADERGAGAVDWGRGLAIARGAAVADLRARTPSVARVGAERRARERARERLAALVARVPWAGGGAVADAAESRPGADARLSDAIDRAIDVDIDYGTDGTVVARLGVPLEALRMALAEAPPPAPAGGSITGLVIRAGGVIDEPALGFVLVAGDERYRAPAVFGSGPSASGDSRLGDRVVRARAESRDGRQLAVDLEPEALAAARDSGALVMVVPGD